MAYGHKVQQDQVSSLPYLTWGDMDTGSTGAALRLFPAGNSSQCGTHLREHSQEEAAGSSPLQPQVSQAVHTPFKNI